MLKQLTHGSPLTSPLKSPCGSSGNNGSSSSKRIRDEMDDILESNGYYRKHMAEGQDSIFKSLAEFLYSTPIYANKVGEKYENYIKENVLKKEDEDENKQLSLSDIRDLSELPIAHYQASVLSEIYNLTIKIINSKTSEDMDDVIIMSHGDYTQDRKQVFLCYTPPYQYDPVFKMETIINTGMIQSIVYQILYEQVFKVGEVMEAADLMLNGEFDPRYGKPEIYDKEFPGTAMEALDEFLIPFPYKVAKALDPNHYRNIDYDVWTTTNRIVITSAPSAAVSGNGGGSGAIMTPGMAVNFLHPYTYDLDGEPMLCIGIYMGLTADRRHVEVYYPVQATLIHVPRRHVQPINNPNRYFTWKMEMDRQNQIRIIQEREEQQKQLYNLNLRAYDPHWLCKFDFSVPPPQPPSPPPNSPLTFQTIFPIIGNCPSTPPVYVGPSGDAQPRLIIDENNNAVFKEENENHENRNSSSGGERARPPNLNIPNAINSIAAPNPSPMIAVPSPMPSDVAPTVPNVFLFPQPLPQHHPQPYVCPPTPMSPFEMAFAPITPGGIPCTPITYLPALSPIGGGIPFGPLPSTPMQEQNLATIFNFCSIVNTENNENNN